ncbi:S-layer homology domain-containing protein [Lysinibacillus xylanilyticus]|uniref:S-layer homology domain-containing protein n=1 Tax=Lysinibacillus xylanilyticus TaxID=582475 RepID=UPI0037FEADD1
MCNYVKLATAKAGIAVGYSDEKLKPHNELTRAHMAAFLSHAMKMEKIINNTQKSLI